MDCSLRFVAWASLLAVTALGARPVLAGADAASPAEQTAPGQDSTEQITTLVRQLGSPSFAERERATRALIGLGIATRDALLSAVKDPDAEVRARARAILATVSESDFRDRLEAFSADYDGRGQQSLPGWERVSATLGNSRLTRQLFVEMQRAEPELMEAYARGGKAASESLDARCRTIFEQLTHASGGDGPVSIGTLASLLLVGSADDVTVDEQLAFQLYSWLIYRPAFQKNASSGPWSGPLKRVLGLWIVKDTTPAATAQNLTFAATYDLKPEGITLAAKLLTGEATTPQIRQLALVTIGRFGDKRQLATVEKQLEDPTPCGAAQLKAISRQVEVQVRDVALAVLLHLTAQAPRDFGAARVEPNPQNYFQVAAIAFANAASREEALKQWQAWRAAHGEP
jgi:hypothetical protein